MANQMIFAFREMLAGALFLVPVFVLFGLVRIMEWKKIVLYLVLSCYLTAVLALVGMPNITYIRFDLNLNLVPFADMVADWQNACLNVAMLVPLGLFLPLYWPSYRKLETTLRFGFLFSLTIELMQIFTFRATDVNDLITNTLGTLIGFFLAKGISGNFKRLTLGGGQLWELRMILLSVLVMMFFVYPFTSELLWKFLYA